MFNSRRGGLFAAVCSAGLICGLSAGPASAETLAEAIALAYDSNPTLQAQRATQRALDENYVQARAGYRPTLSATARHEGYTLGATGRYDIYARLSPQLDLSLGLPRLAETNVPFGYGITKDAPTPPLEEFVESHERRVNIVTSLAHPVTGYIRLQRRDKDDVPPTYSNRFETALGVSYDSPSECWGLQFSRE